MAPQDDNKGFAGENSPFNKDLKKVVQEREKSIEAAFDVLGDYVLLPGVSIGLTKKD